MNPDYMAQSVDKEQNIEKYGNHVPQQRHLELVGGRYIKMLPGSEMMGATIKRLYMHEKRWVFEVEFDNGTVDVSNTDAVRKLFRATIDENRISRYDEWLKLKNMETVPDSTTMPIADMTRGMAKEKVSTFPTTSFNSFHHFLPQIPIPFTLSMMQLTSSQTGSSKAMDPTENNSQTLANNPEVTRPRTTSEGSTEESAAEQPCTLYKGAVVLADGTIIKSCASCRRGHSGLQRCRVVKRHTAPNYDSHGDPRKHCVVFPQAAVDFLGWGNDQMDGLNDAEPENGRDADDAADRDRDGDRDGDGDFEFKESDCPVNYSPEEQISRTVKRSSQPKRSTHSDSSRRSIDARRVRHNILQKRNYNQVMSTVPSILGPQIAQVLTSHPEVEETVDSDSENSDEVLRHTLLQWLEEYQLERVSENESTRRDKEEVLEIIANKLNDPDGMKNIQSYEVEILRTRKVGLRPSHATENSDIVVPPSLHLDSLKPLVAQVDAHVQLSSQMTAASDIIRARAVKESKRQEHYQTTSILLQENLVTMQTEFAAMEESRRKFESTEAEEIKSLEEDERQLQERLRRLREHISQRKQNVEEKKEVNKRVRLSEKSRLYHTQKDIDTCMKAVSDVTLKRDLIEKFGKFVTSIVPTGEEIVDDTLNTMSSQSETEMLADKSWAGRNLCKRIGEWADVRLSKALPTLSMRVIFESIRLARHLLVKYDKVVASVEVNAVFDDILRRCEPYSCGSLLEPGAVAMSVPTTNQSVDGSYQLDDALQMTAVICDSRTLKHLVPKNMVERSYRIVKVMMRIKKLEMALLEDSKQSKRSSMVADNSVKVNDVDNTSMDVQDENKGNAITGETSKKSSSLCDKQDTETFALKCFDVDALAPLPDLFWESVSLVHSDEYLNYLRDRCNHVRDMNTPFLQLKDEAVYLESDDEFEFSKRLVKDAIVDSKLGSVESQISWASSGSGDRRVTRGTSRSQGPSGFSDIAMSSLDAPMHRRLPVVESTRHIPQHDTRNHNIRKGFSPAVVNSILEKDFGPPPLGFAPVPSQRIWLWDTLRDRRISGNAAPFLKNLRECFARNPHFTVYHGQDEKNDFNEEQVNLIRWLRITVCAQMQSNTSSIDIIDQDGNPVQVISSTTTTLISDDLGVSAVSSNNEDNSQLQMMSSVNNLTNPSVQAVHVPVPEGTRESTRDRKRKTFFEETSYLDERVTLWSTSSESRLAGGSAPRRRDLEAYLLKHPHYIVYDPLVHGARFRTASSTVHGSNNSTSNDNSDAQKGDKEAPSENKGIKIDADDVEGNAQKRPGGPLDDAVVKEEHPLKKIKPQSQSALAVLTEAALHVLSEVKGEAVSDVGARNSVSEETGTYAVMDVAEESKLSAVDVETSAETKPIDDGEEKQDSDDEGDDDSEGDDKEEDNTEDSVDESIPYCKEYYFGNREDEAISAPGWWEDLECGSSDTYISADSMESAVAAAAVVCRAVDALVAKCMQGWMPLPNPRSNPKPIEENNDALSVNNPEGSQVESQSADIVDQTVHQVQDAVEGTVSSSSLISESTDRKYLVKNVFCCIRPPGHHAGRFGNTRGCSQNGFCLLNNAAIGAMYARLKYGLRRVAVVDIDAHFGNGTAEVMEGDDDCFYASVHMHYERPRYFFPSSLCCTLGADRLDPNCVFVNVLPPTRSSHTSARAKAKRGRVGFRKAISDKIIPAMRTFKPDIIFISAGFDGVSSDAVGGQMGLKSCDFLWVAQLLRKEADMLCGGRLVSVLEGGYDIDFSTDGLANCVEAHVMGMAGLSVIPDYEK